MFNNVNDDNFTFIENHYTLLFNPEQRPHMYNYWVLTPRQEIVTVMVKACEDAWIAMATKQVLSYRMVLLLSYAVKLLASDCQTLQT